MSEYNHNTIIQEIPGSKIDTPELKAGIAGISCKQFFATGPFILNAAVSDFVPETAANDVGHMKISGNLFCDGAYSVLVQIAGNQILNVANGMTVVGQRFIFDIDVFWLGSSYMTSFANYRDCVGGVGVEMQDYTGGVPDPTSIVVTNDFGATYFSTSYIAVVGGGI